LRALLRGQDFEGRKNIQQGKKGDQCGVLFHLWLAIACCDLKNFYGQQ